MKKILLLSLIAVVGLGVMPAQQLTLKFGAFWPTQDSDLWDINYENLLYQKSDLRSNLYGLELEFFLSRHIAIGIEISNFAQSVYAFYRDPEHADVGQNFSLTGTPVELAIKFYPLGHRKIFIPYAAIGLNCLFWNYEQWGDFVIYPSEEIKSGTAKTNSMAVGASLRFGSIIRFTRSLGLSLEAKYRYTKGTLSNEFEGFEAFDLSGISLTGGINLFFR